MRNFMLQKATFQCWRLFQTLLVTAILCLEIAQLNAFRPWYYEEPSHGNASYFGLVIFITLASLLYFLSSFSYRWITGPYKHEIYADLFLAHLWTIVSLMNIIPSLNGGTLTCKYPEDENHYARITRCHLFLSSMSLGWIVAVTYMVASYVSIMRWNKRPIEAIPPKLVEPPVVLHKPETYLVQKGVLADGQPALIFHMAQKNNSTPNLSAKGTKSGHSSGNVTPTTSSHNGSASNLQNFTLQQTNASRTSIYLHDKVVKP